MDFRAEANHKGFPHISAPTLSAMYSRLRLMAICISDAAKGARIIIAIKPMKPILLFLRPLYDLCPEHVHPITQKTHHTMINNTTYEKMIINQIDINYEC